MSGSDNNQDLQATHKILQLIESSKRQGERILDTIPGLFAVINKKGEILRSNQILAEYFELESEDLLYKNLQELFKQEEWLLFSKEVEELSTSEDLNTNFELAMTTSELDSRTHLWYISKFSKNNDEIDNDLFTVVGKDISDLKAAQQNLIEIFSSVPLGILTIVKDGILKGQVSRFSELLFGDSNLEGNTIKDVLFSRLGGLTKLQEESIDSMISNIGQQELIFSVVKDDLPQRVSYEFNGIQKWFSLTFQPISYEGMVHKILVIVQDITQLVRAENAAKNKNLLEEQSIARIVQLKKIDEDTKPFIFEEVEGLFKQVESAALVCDVRKICNCLHGIKGCARVSGLTFLTEKTHNTEATLLDLKEDITSELLQQEIKEVLEEWGEVFSLDKALNSTSKEETPQRLANEASAKVRNLFVEYNRLVLNGNDLSSRILSKEILVKLDSYNRSHVSCLESILEKTVEKTAAQLQKEINLSFDWDNVYLDKMQMSSLRESLVHILNNAVDHGIESPSHRMSNKKSATGSILIRAKDKQGELVVDVLDDGSGISLEKIRDTAIRNELYSVDEALALKEEDVLNILFLPEFSSSEEVTEISGRGIGLDAVHSSIESLGGTVTAKNRDGEGSCFSVQIPSERSIIDGKETESLELFLNHFQEQISRVEEADQKISLVVQEELLANKQEWKVYNEFTTLLFSLVKIISTHCTKKENEIYLSTKNNGIMELVIPEAKVDLDRYGYVLDTCKLYLEQHQGGITVIESDMHIHFSYLQRD